ncbi:MAG: hypothetical protein U0Y82_14035 [Thermoleophilia bacterium]
MLVTCGILAEADGHAITRALATAGDGGGRFAFQPSDEDIHTAVERRVTELAGTRARACTPRAAATTRWPPTC